MTDEPDVRRLLDLAAGAPADTRIEDDVLRAHHAVAARRRARYRAGAAVTTVAVLATLGVVATLDSDPADPSAAPPRATAPADEGVELISERFVATPYTFDLTPEGWSVQGQNPYIVTIAPDDGSTSDEPLDFRGKLVIMFDGNPLFGRPVEVGGRTFFVSGDDDDPQGYTTVSTRTRDDEPEGVVRIQYPHDAGWDTDTMVEFLASVHVGAGAKQGQG